MSNIEDFNALKEIIMGIDRELIKNPNMPVDVAAQEAEDLHYRSKQDEQKLQAAGLDVSLIHGLLPRVGALRHAESLWKKEYDRKDDAEKEWKELSPVAYGLRKKLVHFFKFAFRKNDNLQLQVNRIVKGTGHADMIQDLSDLAVLGKANTGLLEKVGLDLTKLDTAQEYSDSLAELLAVVNGERSNSDKPAKEMRDRAFIYLKQAVDEIRETGQFVFWQDKEKVLQYGSKYFRARRPKAAKKAEVEV